MRCPDTHLETKWVRPSNLLVLFCVSIRPTVRHQARDEALLTNAKEKLEAAIASYVPTKAS